MKPIFNPFPFCAIENCWINCPMSISCSAGHVCNIESCIHFVEDGEYCAVNGEKCYAIKFIKGGLNEPV